MNETTKTLSLIGAAAVLVVVAFATRPRLPYAPPEGEKDQLLFAEWKDPAAAKSLAITSFDETTSALRKFEVAEVKGRWVIPSHKNYPANAQQKVDSAAADLINLKILGVVSNDRGAQETFGVVEPDENKLAAGATGVGKLVAVADESGKDLARLIIGKEDKSHSEEGPSNLRFVRRAGQDRIYRVSLATDQFSTKFQEWIDTDLLGLKQHWDIDDLQLRDYSLDKTLVRKWDLDLAFDLEKSTWSVKQLLGYKDNHPSPAKLAPDEELDTAKLNDLKTNAAGIKIVDVYRKPASFIAILKAGKSYLADQEARDVLEELGFLAYPKGNPTELLSGGGDLTIGMKDGVEYAIHFGGTGVTLGEASDKKTDAAGKDAKKPEVQQQRVVFVTAGFNQDLIPKPTLEALPEAKKPEPAKPGDSKPANRDAPVQPAPGKSAPNKSTDASKPELLLALADDPKTDGEKAAADSQPAPKAADKAPADKKADEKKPDDPKPADKKPDAGGKPAATSPAAPGVSPKSDIQRAQEEQERDAERKRIETDNHRKQEAYDQAVKQGKDHAKELSARFADWFYMISEDDYKKVHVSRSDIIKKKAGAEGDSKPGPQDPFKVPNPLGTP